MNTTDAEAQWVERVSTWLSRWVGPVDIVAVERLTGGVSNVTRRLRLRSAPADLGNSVVVRQPPPIALGHGGNDIIREARIMERVGGAFPAPTVYAVCDDVDVIGVPFVVLEDVPGVVLGPEPPAALVRSAEAARMTATGFWDLLPELHALDVDALGLRVFDRGGNHAVRQVESWARRHHAAAPAGQESRRVLEWLRERTPRTDRTAVVHNDFKLDNAVLDPRSLNVRAVLDWEMAGVGDPLMDLGCALAYWLQPGDPEELLALRRQPSHTPGMLTRAEITERYFTKTGLPDDDWPFYEVFGLFRLSVVSQQIANRIAHTGGTGQPGVAFTRAAKVLAQLAVRRAA